MKYINYGTVLIILLVGGLFLSLNYGPLAFRGFLAAAGLNALAAGCSYLLIHFVKDCWGMVSGVVAGSAIRLFVLALGILVVFIFFKSIALWFTLWVAVFYGYILIFETHVTVKKAHLVQYPEQVELANE